MMTMTTFTTSVIRHLYPPIILLFIVSSALAPCPEPTFQPDGDAEADPAHSHAAHGQATERSTHEEHSHQDGSNDSENPFCHCDGKAIAGELRPLTATKPCISASITPAQAGIPSPRPAYALASRYRAGPDATGPPLYLTNNTFLI